MFHINHDLLQSTNRQSNVARILNKQTAVKGESLNIVKLRYKYKPRDTQKQELNAQQ